MNPFNRLLLLVSPNRRRMVHPMDLRVFCEQLATILEGGLPLRQAVRLCVERTYDSATVFRSAVEAVADDVAAGMTLSAALRRHAKVFPTALQIMAEAGELSEADSQEGEPHALARMLRQAGAFYADEARHLRGRLLL